MEHLKWWLAFFIALPPAILFFAFDILKIPIAVFFFGPLCFMCASVEWLRGGDFFFWPILWDFSTFGSQAALEVLGLCK